MSSTKTLYLPPNFSAEIGQPYSSGQPIDEIGAQILNTAIFDNIKHSLKSKLAAFQKAWEKANGPTTPWPGLTPEQEESFRDYISKYALSIRTSAPSDPVEAEAYRIAKAKIEDGIKARGYAISDYKDRIPSLISQLLDKQPEIRAEAQRRVDARKEILSEALDLDAIL